jgi:adenosylcobinamide-GDP ribazoletransferase
MSGLRLALAMFTALPVPNAWHQGVTRGRAAATLRWLPLVGALLGGLAGVPVTVVLARDPSAGLLAAALGVAALALLSGGLHLDGLADTADGLGSRADPRRALEIMRRSDIGPFGVVALLLVLLLDVAAVAAMADGPPWRSAAALCVAAATGRLAVVHAAGPGVPSARPNGFGALVAGCTSRRAAVALTLAVLAGGAGLGALVRTNPLDWPTAQLAGLAAAWCLRRHITRRLGGVTGDVFGALLEAATTVTLVALVLAVR